MATRATSVQITMPQMGESVTEGIVLGWLKQVGDRVEADEPLVEVSTDKVDAEIPAPTAGTLVKILVEADETVQVGSVLGEIDPDGTARRRPPALDDSAERRAGRRDLPGDGRFGRRGHDPRVAREGGRLGRGRRPARRDLDRQGRRRGAVSRRRDDRRDPRRGGPDRSRRLGALPHRGGRGRLERPRAAQGRDHRGEARGRGPPRMAETRRPWRPASRAPTASTWMRSPAPARAGG